MKQCPQCSATYNDDMSFCLNDGASLAAPTQADDMPATVMFTPQQSPPIGQNAPSAPTMFSNAPQQSPQQPQFAQQPQFGQQTPFNPQMSGASATPSRNKSFVGIIIVVVVLFFGLIGIVGGLIIYLYSKSEPDVYSSNISSTPNSSNTSSTSNSSNSSTDSTSYSQDTGQGEAKNGFKRISFEDVTSNNFFPSANKTSAATYQDGSARVVSFLSVYDSPKDAEAAFLKYLDRVKSEGKTITTRKDDYAYYNKGSSYSTVFWLNNKLYEFTTNNEQTLYRFAK